MANRQHLPKVVDGDAIDGAVERIRPNTMLGFVLFEQLLPERSDYKPRLTKSFSPMCTVSTAPLANPQTSVMGNVGSQRSAVTDETFKSLPTVSQDSVEVMRIKPFSHPLARYSPSGEKRTTKIELVCPESVSTPSYLRESIVREIRVLINCSHGLSQIARGVHASTSVTTSLR